MKKWIFFFSVLVLFSCKKEQVAVYFTPEKALKYFRSVDSICKSERGMIWGKNLYGPIMFVERETRLIFANQPDQEGILKLKDGIFTGTYPNKLIIDNIAVKFGGTLFAMAPLPIEEDSYRIKTRAIHGLFHCFQNLNSLEPDRFNTRHMDERNARLWLKLEWRAIRNAFNNEGELRVQAIRDALIFRGARRELYPKSVNDENRFENYEGLPTFTYSYLCEDTIGKMKRKLLESLNTFYKFQSFGPSYGFIHGGLYAYLAHEKNFDFRTINTDSVDLGAEVKKIYGIELPEICRDVAGSLALNYNIDSIYAEENKRVADIKKRIREDLSTFTEKPVVYFELESPNFDFEPQNIRSLDTLGTIYKAIRVSDNWGKLTVDEGGSLVSYDLRFMRITAKGYKESRNHFYGDGWHLILNNTWTVVKVEQNYFVRKIMP